jgi:hypothetical protein
MGSGLPENEVVIEQFDLKNSYATANDEVLSRKKPGPSKGAL